MNATQFVSELATIQLPGVFNPYADHCEQHDLPNAAAVRRSNLERYLTSIERSGASTIWMGRDLGYRGGRRTGLALTDESHLQDLDECYPGSAPKRATLGPMVVERTATEIWAAIHAIPIPPLLWNVFPFHPHEVDNPLTNRKFTSKELAVVEDLNESLVHWLKISTVVCIGQDAAKYAQNFGVETKCIRHPSYGGVRDFRAGVESIYNVTLNRKDTTQRDLF
jgi:hypothetical protein